MGLIIVLVGIGIVAALTLVLLRGRRPSAHGPSDAGGRPPNELSNDHPNDLPNDLPNDAAPATRAPQAMTASGPLDREHETQVRVREPYAPVAPSGTVVTEESIGVTRREFFNRSLIAIVGFAITGRGARSSRSCGLRPGPRRGSAGRSPSPG